MKRKAIQATLLAAMIGLSISHAQAADYKLKPLLMIAGSEVDSLYMSEDAFAKATGAKDKDLFKLDGATRIETYWAPRHVDAAMEKLPQFSAEPCKANTQGISEK